MGATSVRREVDRSRERHCAELIRMGDSAGAIVELEALLASGEGGSWAHAHLGELLCSVRGQYAAALFHLTRAIEIDGTYAWALAHRGGVLERLERLDAAEADFRHALELEPNKAWAHAMLCRIHQFSGRFEQAIAALERVIDTNRAVMPDWRAERGLLQTLAGHYEVAHSLYLEAFAHDANDRLASYNVAINMQLWQGAVAAAPWIDAAHERLLELPSGSRTTYELGGLLALQDRGEEALAKLALAVDGEAGQLLLSPSRKRARVDLAWARLRSHPAFLALTRPTDGTP